MKNLIGGMTDYSHQSLKNILTDLNNDLIMVSKAIDDISEKFSKIDHKYWLNKVPYNFRAIFFTCLTHLKTTKEEITSIIEEIEDQVEEHHCKRLLKLGNVADNFNGRIGKIWHNEYAPKDYGNKNFKHVEFLYQESRDMAVSLTDLENIAERLQDFVGKKNNKIINNDMIKILFLSSSPNNESRLRVDLELRKIEEQLEASKHRDKVQLQKKGAVKDETITKAMLEINPDIVHFSGHGDIDGIAIEDDNGDAVFFPLESLKRLFTLFKDSVKCVILNACYSEEQAKIISENSVYVIGMNDSISDDAAIKFSIGFYQAIGSGKDIPFAFGMGMVLISQSVEDANIPTLWLDGKKIE